MITEGFSRKFRNLRAKRVMAKDLSCMLSLDEIYDEIFEREIRMKEEAEKEAVARDLFDDAYDEYREREADGADMEPEEFWALIGAET